MQEGSFKHVRTTKVQVGLGIFAVMGVRDCDFNQRARTLVSHAYFKVQAKKHLKSLFHIMATEVIGLNF